jgi:hypothetical protein
MFFVGWCLERSDDPPVPPSPQPFHASFGGFLRNLTLRHWHTQPVYAGRDAAKTMKHSTIAPIKLPPGGRKHQIWDNSVPAPAHAASPDCRNDHASEGATLFQHTLLAYPAAFRRVAKRTMSGNELHLPRGFYLTRASFCRVLAINACRALQAGMSAAWFSILLATGR